MTETRFSLLNSLKYHIWSCQNVCDAPTFLLDDIFIRSGLKLYRKIVEIPKGINCAPLVASLLLFCYEMDFMMSRSVSLLLTLHVHPDIWMIF